MEYCGIDLASKTSAVCIMTQLGVKILETEFATEREGFETAFFGFAKLRCVMEAGPLAEWVSAQLEEMGHEPVIIDARRAKALISTKKKTDRIDAEKLANLARTGWYNEIHRKSPSARLLRTQLQARRGLVQTAGAMNSRIRGLLRSHGLKLGLVSASEFDAKVKALALGCDKSLWISIKPLCKARTESIKAALAMKKQIEKHAANDPLCQLLMTTPGVGPLVSSSFICTIDDPKRFARSDQVAAYLGLVPSIRQSGDNAYLGRVTKEGDELLRWMLVEAAHVLLTQTKANFRLKQWGLDLSAKKGFSKAKVAVARKLAMILHQLWLTGRPFDLSL